MARSRRLTAAIVVSFVAVLGIGQEVAVAAGSGSGGGSILGKADAASGTPVKIGFVSDGKSEAIDNSADTPAAEAVAKYANAYLGGIGGRPIEVVSCDTLQTPAGAQDCVTKFINENVALVVNGVSGQIGTVAQGLATAGIPLFVFGGIDRNILSGPNSAVMTNGLAAGIAGAVAIGQENGNKKGALVVIDVPAAVGTLAAIAPTFYKNGGMEVEIVKIAPNVADMTPQIQAAITNGADQFAVIGDSSFCQSALQAMQTLNFQGDRILLPACVTKESIKAVDLSGAKLVTTSSDNPKDSENRLFEAVMAKYAKGSETDDIARNGYAAMLGVARALAAQTGDLTPASALAAINSMPAAQMPLAPDDVTFQCGTKPVSIAPAICSKGALVTTLKKNGKGSKYEDLDTTAIVKLG